MQADYIIGEIETKAGTIPLVSTEMSRRDKLGTIKVRWLIGRDNYRIDPGLYATGHPDDKSDVFVSANYKLSFDHLRKNLTGLNAWILVLDTKGVNVWCAAGKGTFGTAELINRIKQTNLEKLISHRKIIVPQLGATGVSAYQVKKLTSGESDKDNFANSQTGFDFTNLKSKLTVKRGFNVVFGPVRASDIHDFINNGYKSNAEMRKVTFNFSDRLQLLAVDIVYARYKLLIAFLIVLFLYCLSLDGIVFHRLPEKGLSSILKITLAYFTGIMITPLILPYIPVRMFAFKGLISGILLTLILFGMHFLGNTTLEIISWSLIISAISSFMAMNFTGASTFTSLSGVKKEMRAFVPIQIVFAGAGLILLTINNLFYLQ